MKTETLKLKCPKCGLTVKAQLNSKFRKFVIYPCPVCHSNVVYYKNKIEIISKNMLLKLKKEGALETCGSFFPDDGSRHRIQLEKDKKDITQDDVLNLKILLETEKDFDKVISKL